MIPTTLINYHCRLPAHPAGFELPRAGSLHSDIHLGHAMNYIAVEIRSLACNYKKHPNKQCSPCQLLQYALHSVLHQWLSPRVLLEHLLLLLLAHFLQQLRNVGKQTVDSTAKHSARHTAARHQDTMRVPGSSGTHLLLKHALPLISLCSSILHTRGLVSRCTASSARRLLVCRTAAAGGQDQACRATPQQPPAASVPRLPRSARVLQSALSSDCCLYHLTLRACGGALRTRLQ